MGATTALLLEPLEFLAAYPIAFAFLCVILGACLGGMIMFKAMVLFPILAVMTKFVVGLIDTALGLVFSIDLWKPGLMELILFIILLGKALGPLVDDYEPGLFSRITGTVLGFFCFLILWAVLRG